MPMDNRCILLVEDNPDDVGLTMRALRKNQLDLEVVVAHDGAEAMEALVGDKRKQPSLVLLDLKLPGMGGLELLRRIRSTYQTRLLPVVVLTSSREESDLIDSYSLGANGYIRKPVNFSEFVEVVRQMTLYWLTMNESPPVSR